MQKEYSLTIKNNQVSRGEMLDGRQIQGWINSNTFPYDSFMRYEVNETCIIMQQIYVCEDKRKHKLGTRMIDKLIEIAKKEKKNIVVCASDENVILQSFLEAIGFKKRQSKPYNYELAM